MMPGRILHCIPTMGGGGAERQLAYLCQGLGALGWDLHVALLEFGPNSARLEGSGAQVHRIRHRSNYDPRILWRLTRLMRHLAPAVVQTWVPMMDILGGVAARVTGSRFILSERSSSLAYASSWKVSVRYLVASQASAIVANSEAGVRYWQGRNEVHRVSRIVIANAVPLDEIDSVQPVMGEEAGVESGDELVLYAGRFIPAKNTDLLIRALARVVATRPRALAILCGEGPCRDHAMDLTRALGIEGRVRMPGYVQDLWGLMKRAQVFVSISLYEGCPNAVVEAMACGCPVVVSDISSHREILDPGSALFVPTDDVRAVTKAILQTLSEPAKAKERASRAKERVSDWSIDAIARKYAEVYAGLVQESESGVPGNPATEV